MPATTPAAMNQCLVPAAEGGRGDKKEQDSADGDDGVVAGALPVAAAEVHPHAEFVERQAQTDAVGGAGPNGERQPVGEPAPPTASV